MNKEPRTILKRRFNGILQTPTNYNRDKNDPKSKIASNFQNAHLKAYLRGDTHFYFGFRNDGGPDIHVVLQEFYKERI